MSDLIKTIGDIPINVDNEGLIIANAMKSVENRATFIKRVNWQEFRMKEYQSIAYGIIAAAEDGVTVEPSMVSLKSRGCPIRFYLDADSIDNLLNKYKEVTVNDFNTHLDTLRLDNVRASIEIAMQDSLHKTLLDPTTKLGDIEERIQHMSEIVQRGYSVSRSEFKTMNEVIDDFIVERETGVFHRTTGFRQLDELLTGGFKDKEITIICGRASMGKTHGKNVPIIMYNGTIKLSQDILEGDLLMGPDNMPRKVIKAWSGLDDMFEITQKQGESYTATRQHVLALKRSTTKFVKKDIVLPIAQRRIMNDRGELLTLSVDDFLKKSNHWKAEWKGYKTNGWELPNKQVRLSPYFLGIWLGDSTSAKCEITNPDKEVREFLKEYVTSLGMLYRERPKKGTECPTIIMTRIKNYRTDIKELLYEYNLINNKHIPDDFKYNSKAVRLELLSGLLDSDGYLTHVTYEIGTKFEKLKDDILYLGRSLGFYCNAKLEKKGIRARNFYGYYWRIRIVGDTHLIPCKIKRKKAPKIERKRNPLVTAIDIKYKGVEQFYSFSLDTTTDQLYILGDGTVTHNSSFTLSLMKNLSNKKVIAPQFALEMPNMSITTKLLAFNSDIAIKKIAGDWLKLTTTEQDIIHNELMRLRQNQGIYLNDKPTQSLAEIREQIMLLQDKLKTTYMVVFVDLFGKIRDFQDSDNFASDYEKKLNLTQVMTRNLGVHMALVAQIRRSPTRKNQRPRMSEIKNAGAWEEVADNIFGLHRENYDPDVAFQQQVAYGEEHMDMSFNPEDNIAELLLLKGRMSGNNKILYMFFNPITTRFGMFDLAYQQELRERMRFSEPE